MVSSVRNALPVFAALALSLSATADAAQRKAKDLLQYIPVDTPYVFATMEQLPDDLQDRFELAVDQSLSAYKDILAHAIDKAVAEAEADEDGEQEAAQLKAFMAELRSLMSVAALREAGFGRGSLMALYGDGLLPVLRLALTDADAFDATLGRLESEAAHKMDVGEVKGKAYRYVDFDDMRLVVATLGEDAVVTIVPASYSEDRLAEALGISKPRQNMWRSKELQKAAKEYAFTDHLIGMIDTRRVVASFIDDPSGRNAELFANSEVEMPELSSACRKEIDDMAAIAPRVLFGHTDIDDDYIDSSMIVEVRDDIAKGLATLSAAVPGLGANLGGKFAWGMSLNPMALRNFIEARLDAMEAGPYECDKFAGLQGGTAALRQGLAQPIPPMVYSLRGFIVHLTNVEGISFAKGASPEKIEGTVTVGVENAEALVTMGAMMDPQIAALNLLPDGKAREVTMPPQERFPPTAQVAYVPNALAMGFGDDAAAAVETALQLESAEPSPFLSVDLDLGWYYALIGQAMLDAEPKEGEDPLPPELQASLRDAMMSGAELYSRLLVNVFLTERGIEVTSRASIKQ